MEQKAAHADAKVAGKGHKEDFIMALPVAIAHAADRKADKHQIRDRVDNLGAVCSPTTHTHRPHHPPRVSQTPPSPDLCFWGCIYTWSSSSPPRTSWQQLLFISMARVKKREEDRKRQRVSESGV